MTCTLPKKNIVLAMNLLSNNPAPKGAQQLLGLLLIFSAICFAVSSSISSENAAVGTQTTADAAFSSKLINELNSTSGRSAPQLYHEESATIWWKTTESQNPTELGPGVAVKKANCTFEHKKTFTNINCPAGLSLGEPQQLNPPNLKNAEEGRSAAPKHPVDTGATTSKGEKIRYALQNFSAVVPQVSEKIFRNGASANPLVQPNNPARTLDQPSIPARIDVQPVDTARIDDQPNRTARNAVQPVDTARFDYQPNNPARNDVQPNQTARIDDQPNRTPASHRNDAATGRTHARTKETLAILKIGDVSKPNQPRHATGQQNLTTRSQDQLDKKITNPQSASGKDQGPDQTKKGPTELQTMVKTPQGHQVTPNPAAPQWANFGTLALLFSPSGSPRSLPLILTMLWLAKHNSELRQPAQTSIKAAGSKSNPTKAQRSIDKVRQIPWLPEAASDPAHSDPNGAPVLGAANRATRQTHPTNKATDNRMTNEGQRLTELLSPSPTIRPSG